MNLKVEHLIIVLLSIFLIYYFLTHKSLISDLHKIDHMNNPHFKAIKDKHTARLGCGFLWLDQCERDHCTPQDGCASGLICDKTAKEKPETWYGICKKNKWDDIR